MPDVFLRAGEANPNDVKLTDPNGTNASAELAAGIGTAYDASISLAPTAGNASGTGTASDVTANVNPTAGAGAGIGAALDSTTSVAPTSGVAQGVGSAANPSASVAASAGSATAAGAAFGVTATVNPTAAAAVGAGSAFAASSSVAPTAGAASGTGAAYDATVAEQNNPNLFNHYRRGEPYPAIRGRVSEWGLDYFRGSSPLANLDRDATVSVASAAGLASGTGQAFDATVNAVSGVVTPPDEGGRGIPGMARVTGPAYRITPHPRVRVHAGIARGTGRAFNARPEWNDDETAVLILLDAAELVGVR